MAGSESDSLMKGGDGISSHSDQSSNLSDCSQVLQYFSCSDGFSASASLLSSIGFGEGGQTLLNSANVSATSASSLTTGGNSIISSNSTLQQNMNTRADSMTSTGAASMGLPTSPLSFSSSNVGLPGSSAFSMASLSHSGLASMNRPEMLRDPSVHPSKLVKLENGYKPVFNGMPSKSGWQYGLNNSDAARQVLGTGRIEQQLKTQGLITSQQHFHMNEEPLTQLQGSLPAVKVANKDLLQQQAALNRLQCGNPLSAAQLHRYDLLQQQPSHVHHQLLQQRLLRMLPPQVQRSHIVQQQHQLQQQQQQQQQQQLLLLQQLQQVTGMGKKHDKTLPGSCSQRVMEYMHHQRMHPVENDIGFWREFTAEFFAPSARKRWCLFRCSSGGWSQRSGIFPQELWCCEICGTSPGRGFEVSVEVMPRLYKSKFDNGEFEELLFIDRPHEYRLSSGQIVLEYDKAVQESVYEQLRVVWEGQLRIIFTTELKILSWDFCAGSHEELLPRRSIVPQVNQLVALASRYQSMVQNSGNNLSAQELQAICKLFVSWTHQLANSLEPPCVNELGFTKRFVRCIQIAEVVNSMKDLIDFSRENKLGPIESLAKFPTWRSSVAACNFIKENQPLHFNQGRLEGATNLNFLQSKLENQGKMSVQPTSEHVNQFQSRFSQQANSLQQDFIGNDLRLVGIENTDYGSAVNSLQASPTSSLSSYQTNLSSLTNISQPSATSIQNSYPGDPASASFLHQHFLQQKLQNISPVNGGIIHPIAHGMSPSHEVPSLAVGQTNNSGLVMAKSRNTEETGPSGISQSLSGFNNSFVSINANTGGTGVISETRQ